MQTQGNQKRKKMKLKNIETNPDNLSKGLQEVAGQISEQDKNAYLAEFKGSITTVNRYLKGEIHNIPVAVVMLQFFRERLKQAA